MGAGTLPALAYADFLLVRRITPATPSPSATNANEPGSGTTSCGLIGPPVCPTLSAKVSALAPLFFTARAMRHKINLVVYRVDIEPAQILANGLARDVWPGGVGPSDVDDVGVIDREHIGRTKAHELGSASPANWTDARTGDKSVEVIQRQEGPGFTFGLTDRIAHRCRTAENGLVAGHFQVIGSGVGSAVADDGTERWNDIGHGYRRCKCQQARGCQWPEGWFHGCGSLKIDGFCVCADGSHCGCPGIPCPLAACAANGQDPGAQQGYAARRWSSVRQGT